MILDRLKLTKPGADVLEIRKTRQSALPGLITSAVWYGICYGILYYHYRQHSGVQAYFENPLHTFFYLIPLFYVPVTLRSLHALFFVKVFVFDKRSGKLMQNSKEVGALADIEQIQMVTSRDFDQTEQQLNVFFHHGKKVIIDQSDHYDEIAHVGRQLAVFLAVDVVDLHR